MAFIQQWKLRAEFARRLSAMYGKEVPAYTTLLDESHAANLEVLATKGAAAQRLGSIERVTAERHGAIRVGTPREMADAARIFSGMGMYPVGFYDLRDAPGSAIPVVSTAFRPIDTVELARNPFRVFTSMLVSSDRRFFTADLQARLENFLRTRQLFCPELLRLADLATTNQGLQHCDAARFLGLATDAFKLSTGDIDRCWYQELHAVSSIAADIGGVTSTHINHLTPRVLDIEALYHRMAAREIRMIETIQGPPRWAGPDLLLRQTSFRALAEPRTFREDDGQTTTDHLCIRFGEVEARGIAVTRAGRRLYDDLTVELEHAVVAAGPQHVSVEDRNSIAARIWRKRVPHTETELAAQDLAYFTYRADDARRLDGSSPPASLHELIEQNWIVAEPVVYEDFLPKSAAGIFQSNLTSAGNKDETQCVTEIDASWMEGVLSRKLNDPFELYDTLRRRSLDLAAEKLGIRTPIEIPSYTTLTGGPLS